MVRCQSEETVHLAPSRSGSNTCTCSVSSAPWEEGFLEKPLTCTAGKQAGLTGGMAQPAGIFYSRCDRECLRVRTWCGGAVTREGTGPFQSEGVTLLLAQQKQRQLSWGQIPIIFS